MYQVTSSVTFFHRNIFSYCALQTILSNFWGYNIIMYHECMNSVEISGLRSVFFTGWQIQACSRNVVEFVKAPKIHKGKGHDKHNKVWDESLLNVKQVNFTQQNLTFTEIIVNMKLFDHSYSISHLSSNKKRVQVNYCQFVPLQQKNVLSRYKYVNILYLYSCHFCL